MSIEETCSVTKQLVGDLGMSAFDTIQALLDQCKEAWEHGTLEEVMSCNSYMMMQLDHGSDIMELIRTATYVKYGTGNVRIAADRIERDAIARKARGDDFLHGNLQDIYWLFQDDVRVAQAMIEQHLEEFHPDIYESFLEGQREGTVIELNLDDIDPALGGIVLSFQDGKIKVASLDDREWVKNQMQGADLDQGSNHIFLRKPEASANPSDEWFGQYL